MFRNKLSAKKYLMVLDDVWNEDREKWDDFLKSFSGISVATGNCMMVTTRSEVVSSVVETLPVHKLNVLSKDDCWSIIKAKVFDRTEYIPLEFEKMGRNIANKCQGVPLEAKVVGGLLFGKSRDEWMSFENNWFSDFGDENPIFKILMLSFDHLSSPSLKKCFSYCSMFPKGYEIEKECLIELWMAEGFLQPKRRNKINMKTFGTNFFNILVHNSLLQVVRRDYYDNVTHCNLHDLVHDLSYSILHEDDKDIGGGFQSRYIGWKANGDGLLSIPLGQEKYVRTLFFDGEISYINFSDFESLHSLTLRGDDIVDLSTSITELKHLRYLDISETRIRCLPDSIGELYLLQTLRAKKEFGTSYLEKLPNSFSNLISLRHLHISRDTKLPRDIGKLTSLQTFPCFHVGVEKGCGISELRNLNDLEGKLEIRNLEKVCGKYEAISANLSQKTNIYELSFMWGSPREVDEANNESVLEGLQPHPNLKSLWISVFKVKSFPQWTLKMAVQLDGHRWEGLGNLMEIKIKDCSEVEELPMLGHLQHLKSLYLEGMRNVQSIGSSFYNTKDCRISRTSNNGVCERDAIIVVFGALERLELNDMPNLIEWTEVYVLPENEFVAFPRLQYVTIRGCSKLVTVPSYLIPHLNQKDIEIMQLTSGKYVE